MNRTILLATAASALMAAATASIASTADKPLKIEGAEIGAFLGKTEADVRSALEAAGFQVSKIETEDDELEADVSRDGQSFEIEISVETGNITETETGEVEDDD